MPGKLSQALPGVSPTLLWVQSWPSPGRIRLEGQQLSQHIGVQVTKELVQCRLQIAVRNVIASEMGPQDLHFNPLLKEARRIVLSASFGAADLESVCSIPAKTRPQRRAA